MKKISEDTQEKIRLEILDRILYSCNWDRKFIGKLGLLVLGKEYLAEFIENEKKQLTNRIKK